MPDLVADDNVYITYESSAGPKYRDSSRHCLAGAVNKHCTPSLCEEARQRSDSVWEEGGGGRRGGTQHGEGGMAAHVRFTDQYQQV